MRGLCVEAEDPYTEIADNLVLVGFMSFRLRIVGLALNHPVVCSDWWGAIGERELAKAGVPYEVCTSNDVACKDRAA